MERIKENRSIAIWIILYASLILGGVFLAPAIIALLALASYSSGGYGAYLVEYIGSSIFLILLCVAEVGLFVYQIIWLIGYVNDLNVVCRNVEVTDDENSPSYLLVWLLGTVTCGIYTYYWFYKQGNRMQAAGHKYNILIQESGTTLLLWALLGNFLFGIGPFITWVLMTKNLNKLAHQYNEQLSHKKVRNVGLDNTVPAGDPFARAPLINDTTDFVEHKVFFNTGEYAGQVISLKDNEALALGRDPKKVNLVLRDQTVSGLHMTIRWSNLTRRFHVYDYSSNGVFYTNGSRLPKNTEVEVPPNTVLRLAGGQNEILLK